MQITAKVNCKLQSVTVYTYACMSVCMCVRVLWWNCCVFPCQQSISKYRQAVVLAKVGRMLRKTVSIYELYGGNFEFDSTTDGYKIAELPIKSIQYKM